MKYLQNIFLNFFLCALLFFNVSCGDEKGKSGSKSIKVVPELNISILTSANSWVYENPTQTEQIITESGIKNWTNSNSKIRTYFRAERTGEIQIGLKAKVSSGNSIVKLTFNGVSKEVDISNTSFDKIFAGTFKINQAGYYFVEIQGVSKTGPHFAEVPEILIGGDVTKGNLYYVKDDVYWGRRGPSVHLTYEKPATSSDIVWFYNELTVPEGNDVVGSYFMANGFGEGYFGMQVNSPTERRFLFSVWSPYSTDDPSSIPEDQRVILLKKGENVTTGEFGNEGAGGQSYRKYMWKSGHTYKFLLKGVPSVNNSTDYTAYIFAPEIAKWELIASFRRPKTNTYLTRAHSFLENFYTKSGNKERKVLFTNQWVFDTDDSWHEMIKAKFTADATARKESRLDYAGGSENGKFYLKNCGFFSESTTIDSFFGIEGNNTAPEIDFESLPSN